MLNLKPIVHRIGMGNSMEGAVKLDVLYLADRDTAPFEQNRTAVDVVCAGDSLTGWNNYGPVLYWPYPCYPQFLQEMIAPHGLRIANCGIAGEVSENGVSQVSEYLDLFPKASYFVIGFGTNDLGIWPDTQRTSRRIIENLGAMVRAVVDQKKQPILFNVPYAKESMLSPADAADLHSRRDYHNGKLREFCDHNHVPLADICSRLADEHLGDELHPNGDGAKVIAEEITGVLSGILRQLRKH